ncbi:MAG: hypothetical protein Q7R49_00670 [Candidatus Daviesbacteria bacterium]|nr:hypothetical protein [Candidatus Daviesbacteria bacterium]
MASIEDYKDRQVPIDFSAVRARLADLKSRNEGTEVITVSNLIGQPLRVVIEPRGRLKELTNPESTPPAA